MYRKRFLLLVTTGILLSACGTLEMRIEQTPKLTPDADTVATGVAAALAAQPSPAPSATTIPARSILVSFARISFTLPEDLAKDLTSETTTDVEIPFNNQLSNGDMPEHAKITLIHYVVPSKYSAYIAIFPANAYSDYADLAAAEVFLLQSILDSPQTLSDYDNGLVPQSLRIAGRPTRSKIVPLQHGLGMRFLTQILDDRREPINNQQLIYFFQGLTADEKYYISAAFPVSASFLQADNNPGADRPPGGIRFPKGMTSGEPSVINQYYDQVQDIMNAAAPGSFTPSLATLDALIESLNVIAP